MKRNNCGRGWQGFKFFFISQHGECLCFTTSGHRTEIHPSPRDVVTVFVPAQDCALWERKENKAQGIEIPDLPFVRKRYETVKAEGCKPYQQPTCYVGAQVADGISARHFANRYLEAVTVLRASWRLGGCCQTHPTVCYFQYFQKLQDPPCFLQTGTSCTELTCQTFWAGCSAGVL